MATFVVSYDAHKVRDYSRFYKAAQQNNGVALLDSMWAFEFDATAAAVRDWAHSLFDEDDSILVLQLKPVLNWSTYQAPVAAEWCSQNIAPMATS